MVEDINLLIIGNDLRIHFLNISNPEEITLYSSTDYEELVSEPYDFCVSIKRTFMVVANRFPNLFIANITDLTNTTLISIWENEFKPQSGISNL